MVSSISGVEKTGKVDAERKKEREGERETKKQRKELVHFLTPYTKIN